MCVCLCEGERVKRSSSQKERERGREPQCETQIREKGERLPHRQCKGVAERALMQGYCDHCFCRLPAESVGRIECLVCEAACFCCEEHRREGMRRHREMCECFQRVRSVNLYEVLEEEFQQEDVAEARRQAEELQRRIEAGTPSRLQVQKELRDSLGMGTSRELDFGELAPESEEARVLVSFFFVSASHCLLFIYLFWGGVSRS